ncbi:hypothetical protein KAX02_08655 [candidate division WOR-3 bacterium]|nr:hypothetical protein [candidate division WOR-3 bacterium]
MEKYDIPEEDVRRMYEVEGMSQQAIANYYGVSREVVRNRLYPKRKEYFREYQENNTSTAESHRKWKKENEEYLNICQQTGLQGLRHKIRTRDNRNKYIKWLRRGLVGDFNIHHEWIPETDKYTFSALVDRTEHQHGIIKPIIILEDNRIKLLQDIS